MHCPDGLSGYIARIGKGQQVTGTDFSRRDKKKYPYYRYGIRDNTETVIGISFQNHDGIF